jgi:transposase-like protein
MSADYQRIEVIPGTARRRSWSTEQKLRIIEETLAPGETISSVARRNGVAPNLLYRWRRLMSEGGAAAVGSYEPVVGSSELRRLEECVRELERPLDRKTMENEILWDALAKARAKSRSRGRSRCRGQYPMKAVGTALGVARSNLPERLKGAASAPRPSSRSKTMRLLPIIRRLVDQRPTYGYRRIAALLNRERASTGLPPTTRKWVHRIMQHHAMLLERHTGRREGRIYDGKVMVTR